MTKSYKMIVLHYMLLRGQDNRLTPVTPEQIAPYFHRYFTEKDYRIRTGSPDKQGQELRTYNEKKITSLLTCIPLPYWSGSLKGLISFQDNTFTIHLTPLPERTEILFRCTEELCDYRLLAYFE